MITTIREKSAPVRIGVDIGSGEIRIGLVDVHQQLIVSETLETNPARPAEQIIEEIGHKILKMLEVQGIALDQCVGIGIGAAGTIDRKNGMVRYSNNIKWENVALAKEIGKYLPIPVKIANNADCAALGEAVAGAGKECQDVVMLTLGSGVGGGIILDGDIYKGKGIGGSELGHMVIAENGEPCTCGRRGCLEAYVSIPALKRDAKRAVGREMSAEEIFAGAAAGDKALGEVVESYIRRLSTGIVNIVNIFRPQMVLIGGRISLQGEELLPLIRRAVKENCFGGTNSELPEIEMAALGKDAGMIGAASLL
ncbi:MAG: ROK family protein [Lachnospiraceae bacterium]|nr:ROK family protein [Lachnospiraceae bacterium]